MLAFIVTPFVTVVKQVLAIFGKLNRDSTEKINRGRRGGREEAKFPEKTSAFSPLSAVKKGFLKRVFFSGLNRKSSNPIICAICGKKLRRQRCQV
jgi:hypothetical protein